MSPLAPARGPFPPLLCSIGLPSSGRGEGAGAVSAAGLLFAPGLIFFLSRAPCLPSSLPFCRLFAAGRPRLAPFWPG